MLYHNISLEHRAGVWDVDGGHHVAAVNTSGMEMIWNGAVAVALWIIHAVPKHGACAIVHVMRHDVPLGWNI